MDHLCHFFLRPFIDFNYRFVYSCLARICTLARAQKQEVQCHSDRRTRRSQGGGKEQEDRMVIDGERIRKSRVVQKEKRKEVDAERSGGCGVWRLRILHVLCTCVSLVLAVSPTPSANGCFLACDLNRQRIACSQNLVWCMDHRRQISS